MLDHEGTPRLMLGRRLRCSALALLCAVLVGCASGVATMPGAQPAQAEPSGPVLVGQSAQSDPVVESPIYALQVGEAAQAARVDEMSGIVQRLRDQTTSGWQARQSDINGWAAEVSGGSFTAPGDPIAVTAAFLDQFGSVFGPASALTFQASDDAEGLTTVRIGQVVGEVPVDGASLIASVRSGVGGAHLVSVRGLLIDTTGAAEAPQVTAAQAEDIVATALGAPPTPGATLVITTHQGQARLAWAVLVTQGPTGTPQSPLGASFTYPANVYVDALNGAILGSRPTATTPTGNVAPARGASTAIPAADPATTTQVDFGYYDFDIPAGGKPITIEANYLGVLPITVNAEQLPDGTIVMIDATGPQASKASKKGVVVVLDGTDASPQSGYLGEVATYASVDAVPDDALYAMWAARQTLDYLNRVHGRLSFDGKNSPVPMVINYTEGDSCYDNAYFATAPGLSHMAIGIPCVDSQGARIPTLAAIEVIGHEIGHGVVNSSTDFRGVTVAQSALDEGTADYLGLAVRNEAFAESSPILAGDVCAQSNVRNSFCQPWRDGVGLRSANTGATFDQYLFTLQDPFRTTTEIYGDDGHINAMVWTNALWQARGAVVALDTGDPTTSERGRVFDRAVLRAASTYFTSNMDMATAADGVRQAASDLGMTAQEQQIVTDRFRANRLCRDCKTVLSTDSLAKPVAVSAQIKSSPVAAGDRVVYLLQTADEPPGAVVATPGETRQQRVGPPATVTATLGAFGNLVLQGQVNVGPTGEVEGAVLGQADLATGATSVVAEDIEPAVAPDASAEATVWVDQDNRVHYRPNDGARPTFRAFDAKVAHVATSGDRVAVLTADGALSVWTVSPDSVTVLDRFSPDPLASFWPDDWLIPTGSLDMSGDRIAAVATTLRPGPIAVYDLAAGTKTTYSSNALPLGVAINGEYVVWVDYDGPQDSPVLSEDPTLSIPDTRLLGYAFATEEFYEMAQNRGQQGFPSLSDRILTWQESANGSSDIYAYPVG